MKTRVLRWITELVLVGMLAGLLFGCGKKDADDSSVKNTETKASSDVEVSEDVTGISEEIETGTDTTEDTTKATSVDTTSEATTAETEVTTSEETLQETSQNTEVPTEPTRSLSDEEAEMSRLREEEDDDDGEEYEEPDGNGNGNGNGNGGNGGTTTTQPTETAAPIQTAPAGHWETRVISEAWDETVVDTPAWDEEVKVAVGTQWIQNDTGTDVTGWSSPKRMDWCDSHNCPNHCDDYDASQPGYCAFNATGTVIYETQIVHHDAVTHVVHHDAVTEQVWVED